MFHNYCNYYNSTIFYKVWELCSSIFGENSTKDIATLVHATPSNIQVEYFDFHSVTSLADKTVCAYVAINN